MPKATLLKYVCDVFLDAQDGNHGAYPTNSFLPIMAGANNILFYMR